MYWRIIILSLFFLSLIPLEDVKLADQISDRLLSYSQDYPIERAYLHTDKPFYVTGEDIWFKAYLMLGPYQTPDTISSVLYVELVSEEGAVMERRQVRINEGLGFGDFHLHRNILPGNYMLQAYTRYMQNFDDSFFYRKGIKILQVYQTEAGVNTAARERFDSRENAFTTPPVLLRFFPEGGDLVEGVVNYVAFKATEPTGKGIEAEGIIVNSAGIEILKFRAKRFGLGLFTLVPVRGEIYTAILKINSVELKFPLPASLKNGYAMHIAKDRNDLNLWVRNNMGSDMEGAFVIGHYRGFPFITIHGERGKNIINSPVNLTNIPSGILHFTFFDSLGIPHCERLVYHENEAEMLEFSIKSDKENYKKREKVTVDIRCTGQQGNPLLTNISLSVTNTSVINPDPLKSNIMSYFNLESDLKGAIENPGYYFNTENKDRLELLDVLLLTHGWRRFAWKDVLNDLKMSVQFLAEPGFNIEGNLVDFYNQSKYRPGYVRLFIFKDRLYFNEMESDASGKFKFEGIDINDSTHVVIQAWEKRPPGKKIKPNNAPEYKNDLFIRIESPAFPVPKLDYWPIFPASKSSPEKYIDLNTLILSIDSSFEGRTVLMDEILIKSTKISNDPYDVPGKLYRNPSQRIDMDSIPVHYQSLLFFDILRRYVPGLSVRGYPPGLQVELRGPRS
ncbi:MAG TPA: hypothetical protein VI583_00825, partial [Cyclobacteriaceae bacterium]|nr:hypothetical protein [Cyclobacteriaceae bacterium]